MYKDNSEDRSSSRGRGNLGGNVWGPDPCVLILKLGHRLGSLVAVRGLLCRSLTSFVDYSKEGLKGAKTDSTSGILPES